jgi:hypothetical protein
MKCRVLCKGSFGMWVGVLALAGGGVMQVFRAPAQTVAALAPVGESNLPAVPVTEDDSVVTEELSVAELADAPVKPLSNDKPIPANVRAGGPAQEVIKLANAGVEESVLLAFVTNSTSTFNLNADEIVYLNDLGIPGSVVTAMTQRDRALQASAAAATPAATQVAPQFDNSAETYPATAEGDDSAFYNSLAPYGTWVEVGGIGPCWQPTVVAVNPGWQPYFDAGHWVDTDCGWYWYSDYSWGWAPFHYGRWFRHHRLGWCWAPGRTWGPSWVCWRLGTVTARGALHSWSRPHFPWPACRFDFRLRTNRGLFSFCPLAPISRATLGSLRIAAAPGCPGLQ